MDQLHYREMLENLDALICQGTVEGKVIYLFGHCNATEELAAAFMERGYSIAGILDNSSEKQGKYYRKIPIMPPQVVLREDPRYAIVCIAARAYAAMNEQLRHIGYSGTVRKLVEYNSYSEYSLSEDTVSRMCERLERGKKHLKQLEQSQPGCFRILCPFAALGDVYLMMSYLPYFVEKRGIKKYVVCVIGSACAQVAELFGGCAIEVLTQSEMDELVQAAIYTEDANAFIAHQDRPYIVDLHMALYQKCIPLEQIYCCGVFGLPADTRPHRPENWHQPSNLAEIPEGRSVVLAPYAKSVPTLPGSVWKEIVDSYKQKGWQCFTNVATHEEVLPGTKPIHSPLAELRAVVERAGTFIGLRSGICDVLRDASCKKIALYPNYHYSDTKWTAMDMYAIAGWENIEISEGIHWKVN